MLEVRPEDMQEIERCLAMIQTMTEEASELTSKLEDGEIVRALTAKFEAIKFRNGFALFKFREMFLGNKEASEDAANLNQKRSRQRSLDIPRGPGTRVNGTLGVLGLPSEVGDAAPSKAVQGGLDMLSPSAADKLSPLKFMKTIDATKAPFHIPSTTFSSTPSKAGLPIESNDLLVSAINNGTGMMSNPTPASKTSKKRPSRSRRDRMRAKEAVVLESVIQTLHPGDNNKIPDDGYLWRKYGNKPIKSASFKRGYFKCRNFKEMGCEATKMVQQINGDQTTFSVSYKGEHTCQQRGNVGTSGLLIKEGGGEQEGATPLSFELSKKSPEEEDEDEDEETNKDDVGDGMGWPSDSVSEDNMLDSTEIGEDAVDSAMSSVDPVSPLFRMPAIDHRDIVQSVPHPPSGWGDPISSMVGSPDFNKIKFSSIENCPLEGNLLDEGDTQLLKMIGDGFWEHPSDISYWYTGVDGQLDQF